MWVKTPYKQIINLLVGKYVDTFLFFDFLKLFSKIYRITDYAVEIYEYLQNILPKYRTLRSMYLRRTYLLCIQQYRLPALKSMLKSHVFLKWLQIKRRILRSPKPEVASGSERPPLLGIAETSAPHVQPYRSAQRVGQTWRTQTLTAWF